MEYTKQGNTGMEVSRVCLGCMGFGDAARWVPYLEAPYMPHPIVGHQYI